MRRKTTVCFLLMLLTAFFPFTNTAAEDNSGEYALESYNVDMVVNENNSFGITEQIVADFFIEKHGIVRKLPLSNTVTRLDGTSSKNRARVTDIDVSQNFETYVEDGCKVIKIGDADYTMTGLVNYMISYKYSLGKDPGRDYDELYFDIIGDQWDTTIDNISFNITMPKEFDPAKLGFSYGQAGSVDSLDVSYSIQGNVISGNYNGRLRPGEALTVRLELPEGYFVNDGPGVDWFAIITICLSLLFVLIVFIMWLRYGKDDQVVETVEFYPPDGCNSAEIGYYYKGDTDNKDITSLLIYLANKGCLKIIEDDLEETWYNKGKNFRIVKVREYDGGNEIERIFFEGLFKDKDEVTYEDLHYKFYKTLSKIKNKFNTKEYKNKLFERSSLKNNFMIILMIIAVFCMITIKPVLEFGEPGTLVVALVFPGVGFTILFAMVFGKTPISMKIFGLIFGGMFGGMPWALTVLPTLQMDTTYSLAYVIGIACVLSLIVLLKLMPKRTPFGIEILGKIKGFKNFLETAEKPQLEAMVMEEPSYFYNILPYTYVLGVSDKWIKKFEFIALQEPDWYSGRSSFDYNSFRSFTDKTISSVSSAMSSSPSSSSGGSGGGSSGGGSGGGGGSSW